MFIKKSQSHKSKDPLKISLVMGKKQDLNIYKQVSINNKGLTSVFL